MRRSPRITHLLLEPYRSGGDETPASIPSSRASLRVQVNASSSVTAITSSRMERFSTPGINPTPMPGMRWFRAGLPESTAALAGSTATTRTPGLRSFSNSPTPVAVPPLPTAQTKTSTAPCVSSQISTAVVRRWTVGKLVEHDRVRDLLNQLRGPSDSVTHECLA